MTADPVFGAFYKSGTNIKTAYAVISSGVDVVDGTPSDGQATLFSTNLFGTGWSGVTVFKTAGDGVGAAIMQVLGGVPSFGLGPGGSTPVDVQVSRTGTAAATVTGTLTVPAPIITGHMTVEGVALTGKTGTGNLVLSASPTFTGTVVLPAATVTLAMHANLAANSIIGNNTDSSAVPAALTVAQTKTLLAIGESDVTNLTTDLAAKAVLASTPGQGGVNVQSGSAYTLVLTDTNKIVYRSSGSAQTLVIPANASVAFPVGTIIPIVTGAGALTVSITSDTLLSNGSIGADTGNLAIKVASTTWALCRG